MRKCFALLLCLLCLCACRPEPGGSELDYAEREAEAASRQAQYEETQALIDGAGELLAGLDAPGAYDALCLAEKAADEAQLQYIKSVLEQLSSMCCPDSLFILPEYVCPGCPAGNADADSICYRFPDLDSLQSTGREYDAYLARSFEAQSGSWLCRGRILSVSWDTAALTISIHIDTIN